MQTVSFNEWQEKTTSGSVGKMFKCQLLFLGLPVHAEGESFVLAPGLCPCVYLYPLMLDESAAYKNDQGRAVKAALKDTQKKKLQTFK